MTDALCRVRRLVSRTCVSRLLRPFSRSRALGRYRKDLIFGEPARCGRAASTLGSELVSTTCGQVANTGGL